MDTLKIEGGVVTQVWRNTARTEDQTADARFLETHEGAAVCGMMYANGVFSNPPPTPRPVSVVTPRQFRLALNATGMRASIEAYVAAGSQDMKDTWEFATVIERSSPLIVAGAAELNLTEAQIDDLFTLAATL